MTASKKKTSAKRQGHSKGPPDAKLDEMIEEAIVDAYGESEQTVAFYTMLEDNLATPFKTEMLGVEVTVERLDMTDDEQIVAVCARGKSRQGVPILDLPLPTPPPEGADWVMAYRRWARGGR
ncbi:MAG: calcium-binding protein [Myxococcota bacterium]|jgi:hypothetical protein|nr:calcium-binding protein [Myxococcota bacterium]